MAREFPAVRFERYVDDVVVHAATQAHAERLRSAIETRMVEVGLQLHPDKTRIVYCKDANRRGTHVHTSFTFLGYTFRTRSTRSKHGLMFAAFLPAVSQAALVDMRPTRSAGGDSTCASGKDLADLARWLNPIVRGWMQYYGRFYRSMLYPLLRRINTYLVRWARKKYRTLHGFKKAKSVVASRHRPLPARVRSLGLDPGLPVDRMVRAV